MQVSYIPLSLSLTAPGDRRRFAGFAKHFGIPISLEGKPAVSEVVVLSQAADLSSWVKVGKTRTKLIFDFSDAYLLESPSLRKSLRGSVKFTFGKTKHLHLSYTKLLASTCKLADAVVCTTEAQKQSILPFCDNVHIIQDFQENEVSCVKTDYGSGEVFNLVWEGFPYNISTFRFLDNVLARINEEIPLALHLLTDIEYPLAFGTHFHQPTKNIVNSVFSAFPNVYLYEWNKHLFSSIATICDMALIPMPDNTDGLISNKAPNKLNLFWRMGLPVLTSPTPSYKKAMAQAGISMLCQDETDWYNQLKYYITNEAERRKEAQKGRLFVEENHSDNAEALRWISLFNSVGIDLLAKGILTRD